MSRYRNNMKMGLALSAAVFLVAPYAMAVFTTPAESWTESTSGDITIVHNGGNVTVICASYGGFPNYAEARLSAHANANPIVGNYIGAGANSINYDATVVGNIGAGTRMTLSAGSGRKWYSYTGVSSGNISKPLDSPWTPLGGTGSSEEWDADMADVVDLGVTVNRGDGYAQSIAITDFELSSVRAIGSLSPLELALLNAFGVTSISDLSAADAALDSDGDGMTDLNEILAENDPDYYSEVLFLADVVTVTDTGVTLEWVARVGGTYQIYRMDSLVGGVVTAVGDEMTATETGYASSVETYDGPGGYYWVKWTNCP